MNELVVVGLNHKTAPVELRERCRVEELAPALAELKGMAGEVAVLDTCNRLEIYLGAAPDPDAVVAWIAARADWDIEKLRPHCYRINGRNACKHLFFVASSLDSLVVGETQIRGQVKRAYREAADLGCVGPRLHGLFQAALRVSKEIAERTGVGRGSVSVAGAAADLAERVFGDLAEARVLVVGAGETAELVMTHLWSRGVRDFGVVNRDPAHARELADKFDADAAGLDALADRLRHADVVVAAAGGEEPLLAAAEARAALRRRRGRPIVAIDIAMPRAVDPAVDALDNLYRYDMDALTAVTEDALRHRRKEFLQCCTLIDAATLRLAEMARGRQRGRAIAELEALFRGIADAELKALERRLPGLQEDDRAKVHHAVHRIVRKLLHMPTRALREGSPEESEAIRKAFAAKGERR